MISVLQPVICVSTGFVYRIIPVQVSVDTLWIDEVNCYHFIPLLVCLTAGIHKMNTWQYFGLVDG